MKILLWALMSALLTAVMAWATEAVSIHVDPHVLMEGGSVQIQCRILRDPENRWLEMGIEGYASHGETVNGEHSPTVYTQTFQHIPCGATYAYCFLGRKTDRGRSAGARSALDVNCEGQ